MPNPFDRYNDGTQNPPRLQVQHSLWSLLKLPMNAPAGMDAGREVPPSVPRPASRASSAGWTNDEREHKDALDAAGLRLTLGHHPFTLDDVRQAVAQAVRLKADFVFAQPLHPYVPLSEPCRFCARRARSPTTRACVLRRDTPQQHPESLNQALELIERMPDIRFTGDLSHFVVVGEFYGWEDEGAIERMLPVLERTSHLHGRISNGEQVQVDVGDGTGDTAQFFVGSGRRRCGLAAGARPATCSPSPANSARPATPSPCPTAASSATAGSRAWS